MQNKYEAAGKKVQSMGCVLTLLITIPILLTAFLGIPGLIIGILIAIVGVVAVIKGNKKGDDELTEKAEFKTPYAGPLTINARPPKKFSVLLAQDVPAAGISHQQETVKKLIAGAGRQIVLLREPENPHDGSAIKVMGKWTDEYGDEFIEQVGYVPAELAKSIHEKYSTNELKGCLKVIYQPQPDREAGIRFDIYAAPINS